MRELFYWWQHLPEHISPVLMNIGPVQVHYYGLMYLAAFFTVYALVMHRLKSEKIPVSKEVFADYFFHVIIALLIGGRLGYVVLYNLPYYLERPLEIILPFDVGNGFQYIGLYGMSYHGGLIGVIIATALFCRKRAVNFWQLTDLLAPAVPLGYTFGRIGNFLNGELYGRMTRVAWGMFFPLDPANQLRHPSQLYEALFEGIFLFLLLWSLRKRARIPGCLFSWYLIGYGTVRFFLEFFREPDRQLGFIFGPFTMGQVLCFLMIATGIFLYTFRMAQARDAR